MSDTTPDTTNDVTRLRYSLIFTPSEFASLIRPLPAYFALTLRLTSHYFALEDSKHTHSFESHINDKVMTLSQVYLRIIQETTAIGKWIVDGAFHIVKDMSRLGYASIVENGLVYTIYYSWQIANCWPSYIGN